MKMTMGTFVMDGNLLMIKFDFVFVIFGSLNSDINLKLYKEWNKFRKGLNWCKMIVVFVIMLMIFSHT